MIRLFRIALKNCRYFFHNVLSSLLLISQFPHFVFWVNVHIIQPLIKNRPDRVPFARLDLPWLPVFLQKRRPVIRAELPLPWLSIYHAWALEDCMGTSRAMRVSEWTPTSKACAKVRFHSSLTTFLPHSPQKFKPWTKNDAQASQGFIGFTLFILSISFCCSFNISTA